MYLRRAFRKVSALILVYLSSMVFVAHAGADNKARGVPFPEIAIGQGNRCVEDTDFMRRNHMDMLKHQRDETTRKGLRPQRHSLKACINCHVVNGPDTKPVTVASSQHFCRSCHDYAAVSIDCFQCHASRPESGEMAANHDFGGRSVDAQGLNGVK